MLQGQRDRDEARADTVTSGRANGGLVRRLGLTRLAKVAVALADMVVVIVAMAFAFVVRNRFGPGEPGTGVLATLAVSTLSLPVWLAAFAHQRLYSARYLSRRPEELRRILRAVAITGLFMAVTSVMLSARVPRTWFLLTLLFAVVFLAVEREVVRRAFLHLRRSRALHRPVVVVGANLEAAELCAMIDEDPSLGYRVLGLVADGPEPGTTSVLGRPLLGGVADTVDVVQRTGAVGVIVATTGVDQAASNRLVRQLTDAGIHVELSSTMRDIAAERLTVRPLGRVPVIYVEPVRRDGWRPLAKRAFDVVVSTAAMVATAPFLALVVIAVRLDSNGPVLFRQVRVGRNGRPFEVLKFRTMVEDAESLIIDLRDRNEADGPLFKITDDPRITRAGRFLRRTSVDELPQLWNVLRGEMSLVGPRPALPTEVTGWRPELHDRLRVKPGITGMWQVNGRSGASFEDYARLDLYYVDNWSLATDLAILAKTVPTVLRRRGAY